MLKKSISFLVGLILITPPAFGLAPKSLQTVKTIHNGSLTLSYKTGGSRGLELLTIGDTLESEAFNLSEGGDLWSIVFRNANTGCEYEVFPSTCVFNFSHSQLTPPRQFVATWNYCDPPDSLPPPEENTCAPSLPTDSTPLPIFKVKCTVSIPTVTVPNLASVAEFKILVDIVDAGPTPVYSIKNVRFPRIKFKERPPPTGTERLAELAWPRGEGIVVFDPLRNTHVFGSESDPLLPGFDGVSAWHPAGFWMSMQFLSYYQRAEYNAAAGAKPANLLMGTRDLEGHFKVFDLGPAGLQAGAPAAGVFPVKLIVEPEDSLEPDVPLPVGQHNYDMPFPFILGVIRGDWYDACAFYRKWVLATQPPWLASEPMEDDDDFSSYLKEARAWGYWTQQLCDECPGTENKAAWVNLQERVDELACKLSLGGKAVMRINGWDRYSHNANPGEWLPLHEAHLAVRDGLLDLNDAGLQPPPCLGARDYKFHLYFNLDGHSRGDFENDFPHQPVDFYPTVSWSQTYCDGTPFDKAYDLDSASLYELDPANLVPKVKTTTHSPRPRTLTAACADAAHCPAVHPNPYTINKLDARSPFVLDYIYFHLKEARAVMGTVMGNDVVGLYLDAYAALPPDRSYGSATYPDGGGASHTLAKVQHLADVRELMQQCDQEIYFDTESNQEMYIKHNQISHDVDEPHYGRFNGDPSRLPSAGVVSEATIPMFQSVYHDYHLSIGVKQILWEHPPAVLNDYLECRAGRMAIAAALSYGCFPGFGGVIRDKKLEDVLQEIDDLGPGGGQLQNNYADYLNTYASFMELLTDDPVRAFTVFGERVRDPKTTNRKGTTNWSLGSNGEDFMPDGRQNPNDLNASLEDRNWQPYVYVGTFRRVSDAPRPSLGILMLNWSLNVDDEQHNLTDAGDGQQFEIEIDPTEYGLTGSYERVKINANGTETSLGNVTFGTAAISFSTSLISEMEARFWVFRPIP